MTASVALIGANGHGRWHRRRLGELEEAGLVRVVALCDTQPILPPVSGTPVFASHREMLANARPDAVVICTPPHTHLPIALDCIAAGCDLLLEKPPVASLAAHRTLTAALTASGRACQVGFQALGSSAWAMFRAAVAETGVEQGRIAAVASWQRDDAYYERVPWAGRRTVAGRPVIDGALVNPLAHAVMQALATAAVAGAGRPRELTVERYRTRPWVEVDDTAFARITFGQKPEMVVAVTLSGEDFIAGEIVAGRAVLEYPTDRVALGGSNELKAAPGRTDLLTNLIEYRAGKADLLVPLAATRDFTAVLEALTEPDIPLPAIIDESHLDQHGGVRTIRGINAVLRRVAETGVLPSESGAAWATAPYSCRIPIG
jgi:predicted dehydrogenase